jgi:hypothetical protein
VTPDTADDDKRPDLEQSQKKLAEGENILLL